MYRVTVCAPIVSDVGRREECRGLALPGLARWRDPLECNRWPKL